MKKILFVCTANICRSPMAAAVMRRRIAELGLSDKVEVASAGVFAEPGHAPSRFSAAVLAERGMDVSQHRSRSLTLDLLREADLVLVMEEAHRRSIFYLAPHLLPRVFLLSEMAGQHTAVADPFGGTHADYDRTADALESLTERGLPGILRRLGLEPLNPASSPASEDSNAA